MRLRMCLFALPGLRLAHALLQPCKAAARHFETTAACLPSYCCISRLLLQGLNLNAIWSSPVSLNSYGGYHGWVLTQPELPPRQYSRPQPCPAQPSPSSSVLSSSRIISCQPCPLPPHGVQCRRPLCLLSAPPPFAAAAVTGPSTCMPSMASSALLLICSTS